MKIIKQSYEIISMADPDFIMEILEKAGKTCYKSETGNPEKFLSGIIKAGHESILEHMGIVVKLTTDRGVMAELTRHRVGVGFSIQSTRYCNFSKDKFGNEITVIKPFFWEEDCRQYNLWFNACKIAEDCYLSLIENGAKPEQARTVLPNSLATEIIFSANIRALRHVFNLRCSIKAHPQIRELLLPLLEDLAGEIPVLFGDIWNKYKGA